VEPTYRFKILSPKSQILDEEVVSMVAPGEAGYLGVLANHAPLVSTMKEGEVRVTLPSGTERRFRIGGGILRVAHNAAVLLAESIEEMPASG
jgi:F-type H+-transporting ATPase subunit epsilon